MPKPLVFLVHGFMGHPREFDPLVSVLEENGFDTHRFSLPHHGDSPGNLGGTTHFDLLATCQAELERCRETHDTLHLLGFSLGGSLSVLLNHHNPDVFQTLTLVAPPSRPIVHWETGQYHLKNFFTRFLPGTQYWRNVNTGLPKPLLFPFDMPGFFNEMHQVFNKVNQLAPLVETPTLLLHSPYDLTVPYDHSEWLYETLPAGTNFVTLLHCGHQIFPFHVEGTVETAILNHLHSNAPLPQPVGQGV